MDHVMIHAIVLVMNCEMNCEMNCAMAMKVCVNMGSAKFRDAMLV